MLFLTYKDTWNNPKSAIKTENFGVFNKKMRFFFVVSEKTTTFAVANLRFAPAKSGCISAKSKLSALDLH
jgi:hypothetical protein